MRCSPRLKLHVDRPVAVIGIIRIVNPLANVHEHTVRRQNINNACEDIKVDQQVFVDAQAEIRRHRLHRQRRTAAAGVGIAIADEIRLIDARAAKVWDIHPKVARQRQQADRLEHWVDIQQHHRIGAEGTGIVGGAALVNAEQQDLNLARVGDARQTGARLCCGKRRRRQRCSPGSAQRSATVGGALVLGAEVGIAVISGVNRTTGAHPKARRSGPPSHSRSAR